LLNCPDRSFYSRSTQDVARELIGKKLVRLTHDIYSKKLERLCGIITETEAYGFRDDRASHAYRGLTARNISMFGEVGKAYVYFVYGNHFCLNVSAHSDKVKAGAVLIRALNPCEGIHTMERLRNFVTLPGLTSGPGKICQAMDIDKSQNALDMTDLRSEIHIEFAIEDVIKDVVETERIGIRYATNKKWRFVCNRISL
jgi:DNA-3-methyladenine glycosylase